MTSQKYNLTEEEIRVKARELRAEYIENGGSMTLDEAEILIRAALRGRIVRFNSDGTYVEMERLR